jgi:hypothetical protein
VAIFTGSVVSHQLTPLFMLAACCGLILARRCELLTLPVLLGVIFTGWVSFGAVAYWSGHMAQIFGGFGDLNANVSASVGARLSGVGLQHEAVLVTRVGVAAAMVLLAAAGLVRRRRAGLDDRVLLVLACAPFIGFGVQSYGGEIALRVYLFALPALSVLTACALFPQSGDAAEEAAPRPGRARARRRRAVAALAAAGVLSLALTGLFLLTRYGNEQFEQSPPGELAAMNYVYAHASRGVVLNWLSDQPASQPTPNMPWSYRDLPQVSYVAVLAPRDPARVSALVAQLRALGPGGYLITTSTQEAYLEQAASYEPGWGGRFRAAMAAARGIRTAFADSTAAVYAYSWPPGARPADRVQATSARVRPTLWTPLGYLILILALAAGLTLEVLRAARPGDRRALRLASMAALPLAVVLVAVAGIRFGVLS